MKKRIIFFAAVALFVTACAGQKLKQAREIKVIGTDFQQTLYQEYLDQAEQEYQAGDKYDADFYATRAITAGSGNRVQPYTIDENGLPSEAIPAMRNARMRLMKSLEGGARKTAPKRAARAQAAFDCWVEEAMDGRESERRYICRERFEKNISEVEDILNQE
jgi:OmpA-OmpF porin, OOP family